MRSIAVLRPNALGDFMFCLPALHALRQAYPQARIVYLGQAWHAQFLKGRPGPVDEVLVVPPCRGVGAGLTAEVDEAAIDRFLEAMRARQFDLALQMYGGGRFANPLLLQMEAGVSVGLKAADAVPLDRCLPYEGLVNRRLQLLELVSLVGASWAMQGRELVATPEDRRQADRLLAAGGRPLVILQPGASDPRRRWPAHRFGALGDALAAAGYAIAVNGSEAEAGLVREVMAHMRRPACDLSGRASLPALCGLLARAAMIVSNDTGPLHLALALGTPALGIYWLSNVIESAPLHQRRHRAAVSLQVHCSECGAENLRTRCPHDPSFVDSVPLDEVTALAFGLLREG